ncbi:MAG: hypothetical protein U0Y10_03555 [Spirosomataceae bacterium]
MKKLTLLLGSVLLWLNSWAQEEVKMFGCNYFGGSIDPKRICQLNAFVSNKQAEEAVDRILKPIGLNRNFMIVECPMTENCFATTLNGVRYIVYDKMFLQRVDNRTKNDWSAISIMAHELGHHLQGHTIDGKGSRPEKELEADKFSGFILHQLGASLEQAQAAIKLLQTEEGTFTHPPRRARLSAIEKGWQEAAELYPRDAKSSTTAGNTPILKKEAPVPISEENNKPVVVEKKWSGCLSGNCSNGKGVYMHELGEKYDGEWKEGQRHGYGSQYYSSGNLKYEGDFQYNKMEGNGTFYYKNGDRYEGEFHENKRDGKGTYYFANGDKFVGDYKDDKRNGKGTMIYGNGKKEISYFLNDKKQELKNRW